MDYVSVKSRLKLLLLACLMTCNIGAYSQGNGVKVSINRNNITIKEALQEVEKQSKMSLAYNESKLNGNKRIALNLTDKSLDETMDAILKETGFSYELKDEQIMIVAEKNNAKDKKTVKGQILDEIGEPLPGATISIKGGTVGTIADYDGNYSLSVSTGDVLVFSFLGYTSKEITVGTASVIDVKMVADSKELDAVVVTALGIKRSEKALSYNVKQVTSDDLTTNRDANMINALSGKVAGLNVNASSSGVGGISKVTMRGTKSIMQSSAALYVIDGVPMFSAVRSGGGGTEFDSQGATDPMADINPEDVESMSVLSGAAAAALYGSDAANGAIIINTKKGKAGRVSVTVNSNVEFNNAFVLPEFQTRYQQGQNGIINASPIYSWGSKQSTAKYVDYDPKSDYFKTGIIATENVSISTGTEKNQTYASVGVLNSKGIVPNNKYARYNFNFRNTTSLLNDKMQLDVAANYIRQEDRNTINQGTYNNPIVGAYLYPRGREWSNVKTYEEYDPARKIYTQRWEPGDAAMTMQNPYWINYRNLRENRKDRYMLSSSLSYKVLDWLDVSGRIRLDNSNNDYTKKFFASTNTQLTEASQRGLYAIDKSTDKQLYGDLLVNINKTFAEVFTLQANIGASFSDSRYDALKVEGPIADGTDAFGDENVGLTNEFNVQNLSKTKTKFMQEGYHEQVQSIYASAELGYKSTYYLTLTGRNDWPSALKGPLSTSKSFFYPSVGLSTVVTELMPNLNRDYISFAKVRLSYANVGNAFPRYIAYPTYPWNDGSNSWDVLTNKPINLKPERTESYEVGFNVRFLKNFELDFTYYNAKTKDQVIEVPGGVEYSKSYVQGGSIRNQGLEISLNYNNEWGKFAWDTGLTFSMNRNKVLSIPGGGEYLALGGLGSTRFVLREGGDMGDLYSLIDMRRDANGKIYIDENDKVYTENITDIKDYIKLGSVTPKGNLAWRNNFSWNGFTAGFLVSARLGGIAYSRTQAMLDQFGVSEATAKARDRGYATVDAGDKINPENWYSVIGGGTSVPQYYTYSATNVRLQEASIGYNIPKRWVNNVCDIKVSLVGRNLWMIYNKAPFDPEALASTSNFYQGIDYFMVPSLRSYGFNVTVKF